MPLAGSLVDVMNRHADTPGRYESPRRFPAALRGVGRRAPRKLTGRRSRQGAALPCRPARLRAEPATGVPGCEGLLAVPRQLPRRQGTRPHRPGPRQEDHGGDSQPRRREFRQDRDPVRRGQEAPAVQAIPWPRGGQESRREGVIKTEAVGEEVFRGGGGTPTCSSWRLSPRQSRTLHRHGVHFEEGMRLWDGV